MRSFRNFSDAAKAAAPTRIQGLCQYVQAPATTAITSATTIRRNVRSDTNGPLGPAPVVIAYLPRYVPWAHRQVTHSIPKAATDISPELVKGGPDMSVPECSAQVVKGLARPLDSPLVPAVDLSSHVCLQRGRGLSEYAPIVDLDEAAFSDFGRKRAPLAGLVLHQGVTCAQQSCRDQGHKSTRRLCGWCLVGVMEQQSPEHVVRRDIDERDGLPLKELEHLIVNTDAAHNQDLLIFKSSNLSG